MYPRIHFPTNGRCGFLALALVCLAATGAGAAGESDRQTEFDSGEVPARIELPRVEYRLEAGLGVLVFSDEDMSDDYSSLPEFRLGLTTEIGENNQFLFAVGYGKQTADLSLYDPTFQGSPEIELQVIPILVGVRTNLSGLRSFRANVGLALQVSRLKETAPFFRSYPFVEAGVEESVGWGRQFLITTGPEWRWNDGAFCFGAEAYASLGGGTVDTQYGRDVIFEGFGGRIYGSWRIGTHEEEPREVRR